MLRSRPDRSSFIIYSESRIVSNENSVQAMAEVISPNRTAKLKRLGPWLSLMKETRRCTRVRGSTVQTLISKRQGEAARGAVASGAFRQPVVHSGDAVHRLAALPRRIPFSAAESALAQASPCLRRDAFSIGDSNRNTN